MDGWGAFALTKRLVFVVELKAWFYSTCPCLQRVSEERETIPLVSAATTVPRSRTLFIPRHQAHHARDVQSWLGEYKPLYSHGWVSVPTRSYSYSFDRGDYFLLDTPKCVSLLFQQGSVQGCGVQTLTLK